MKYTEETLDNMSENVFDKLRPVQTKRASEAIYDQVRDLILNGELKPNDRLPSERQMMEMFQRSRPTIREALRMLERAGLICITPGTNGALVQTPGDKNMEETVEDALRIGRVSLTELSEYRMTSETATVVWAAARRTKEDIAAMEEVLQQMQDTMGDADAFIELDPQFHGLIASAAGNRISVVMNRSFSKLNVSFMKDKMHSMSKKAQREMIQRVYDMHENIFTAIRDGNEKAALKAMTVHMEAFRFDLQ